MVKMQTGTKRKVAMESFGIHDDREDNLSEEATARSNQEKVEEDDQSSGLSEDDDDSVVDDAVAEDMEKFRNSIRGLSRRFRLIKRIGEGMLYLRPTTDTDTNQRC